MTMLYFIAGDGLNQFYIPILVPIGLVGNFLSFLVRTEYIKNDVVDVTSTLLSRDVV